MKEVRVGDVVEITRDINAIPKGIYKVFKVDEDAIGFSIGKSIFFTVSYHALDAMKVLPKSTLKRTSNKVLLPAYYNLLHTAKRKNNNSLNPEKPLTHCILSPSVAAEYEFH